MNVVVIPFFAAILTALIETLILALAGYRTRVFIAACVLINIATNLTLNVGLSFTGRSYFTALVLAEIVVVLIEWAVLSVVADHGHPVRLISRPSMRLLLFVFIANLVTYILGLFLFLAFL